MNNPQVGKCYIFDYPIEFTTLPAYSAMRQRIVQVLRPLTDDEAEPVYDDGELVDVMFEVTNGNGWIGHAWDSELVQWEL